MSNPQDEREALVSRHMQLVTNFGNAQVRANPNTSTDKLRQKVEDSFRAALANQRAGAGVPDIPKELDVRTILLDVVPGEDGMGEEVFAKTVADVEKKLGAMGEELEDWQLGIRRYQPEAVPQGGQWKLVPVEPTPEMVKAGWHGADAERCYRAMLAAAPPSPQPPAAQATLTTERIAEIVRDHLDGIYCCTRVWEAWSVGTMSEDDFVPAAEIEMADEIAAALIAAGIGTAKPAQPEDENEVLRQKVKTLAREAWAWSKACEAESMKLTAVRKAIADAFLPMSRSGLWTKEHSQSYPSKAAEIINAARSIFDVEASQPAQPEGGITAPAGGGEGV